MSTRGPHPWWIGPAAHALAFAAGALGATWRITRQDHPDFTAGLAAGERFIYAFYHSQILPLAYLHRHEGIAVLVSQHRDGELTSRVIEALGYRTARGSSTRGGDAGLRELFAWSERGHHLGITPDGPRGPAERVKVGLPYVARRLGWRVVPMAVCAAAEWRLRSWDRFRVPKPFTRLAIVHGAPVAVSSDTASHDAEAIARLEAAFEAARSASVAMGCR